METPNGTAGSESRCRTSLPPYYVIKRVLEGYPAYYVLRVDRPDDPLLSLDYYDRYILKKGYITSLSHFIRPECVDSEIEQQLGKPLDEGQFKELMSRHIHKCFKHSQAVNSRLEKLENYVNMKVGKMKFPTLISCWGVLRETLAEHSYLCWCQEYNWVYRYCAKIDDYYLLYEDGFCLDADYGMTCSSYNPEDVDVETLVKLNAGKPEWVRRGWVKLPVPVLWINLGRISRALEEARSHYIDEWCRANNVDCADTGIREWVESRLEKARQVINYVLFLTEMLVG